jgi:hypothetical protein
MQNAGDNHSHHNRTVGVAAVIKGSASTRTNRVHIQDTAYVYTNTNSQRQRTVLPKPQTDNLLVASSGGKTNN